MRRKQFDDAVRECLPMLDPRGIRRETRVVGQNRVAERLRQPGELGIIPYRDDERPVSGRVGLIWTDGRMGVTHALRDDAAADECGGLVHHRREQSREERYLDPLAFTCSVAVSKGGEDRNGRVKAREDIDNSDTGLRGLIRAGDAHETAHGLHEQVVAGKVVAGSRAESADGAVHDPWVADADAVIVQAVLDEGAGLEVLDEYVGSLGELAGKTPVAGIGNIEAERLLIAIHGLEVGRVPGLRERRAPRPRIVAGTGPLDLHDRGAEIAEDHGGVGPGKHAGEVGDEHAVKCARARGFGERLSRAGGSAHLNAARPVRAWPITSVCISFVPS